jgi:hypothetical protein
LDGVLGQVVIAKDPKGDREEAPADEARECVECLVLAAARALHQVSLHHISSIRGGPL